jgi:asparagine synthase (glutamine-hydrolysing)
VLDVAPDLVQGLEAGLGSLRSALAPDFLRAHRGTDVYRSLYARCDARAGISRWEPVHQLRYLWFHSIFPNHLAADRLDMAHGVEVRLPYLDHVLFEYLESLPLAVLAGGPQEKWLLREVARPFLPESAHQRKKRPFWAPPGASRGGSRLHELTQDTLRTQRVAAVPFLDPAGVARLLDAPRGTPDALLMMLVSICLLHGASSRGQRGISDCRWTSTPAPGSC